MGSGRTEENREWIERHGARPEDRIELWAGQRRGNVYGQAGLGLKKRTEPFQRGH